MSENKGRFREHISAAKDWLGKAEKSIDDQNDIRGDLNLLLAQAELQKATENKEFRRRRGVLLKALALCAALFIAVGGFLVLKTNHGPFRTDTAQMNVEHKNPASKAVQPEAKTEQNMEQIQPDSQISEPVENQEAVQDTSQSQQIEQPVYIAPERAEKVQDPQTATDADTPKMPSADKQKLMQSAGKILRQQ